MWGVASEGSAATMQRFGLRVKGGCCVVCGAYQGPCLGVVFKDWSSSAGFGFRYQRNDAAGFSYSPKCCLTEEV